MAEAVGAPGCQGACSPAGEPPVDPQQGRAAAGVAGALPPIPAQWAEDPLVRADWADLRPVAVHELGDAMLVVTGRSERPALVGFGEAGAVVRLVREHGPGLSPRWMTVPHGAGAMLTPTDLELLGLEFSADWDWFFTRTAPPRQPGEERVAELDREAELAVLVELLAEVSPLSEADPHRPARWFGVREDGRLIGVIAAKEEDGPAPDEPAWHLQGLAVRPETRGCGLGAALTAHATRLGLAEVSARSWVSLGMYTDNGPARRIYDALGFTTHARNTSYRAVTPA